MSDPFTTWKLLQDKMIAAQKAQLEAASKLIGAGTNFTGAAEAAQKVAEANKQAWDAWLALWTPKLP